MKGRELTRRQILAGAAGAGGTGLLVGTGTGALLADKGVFGNAYVVGDVDTIVTWDGGSSENGTAAIAVDEPTGSETLSVALPELDDEENNPAYLWFRLTCPGSDVELACDLEVSLSYACGNNPQIAPTDGREYAPLLEVANQLRTGVPLYPNCDPSLAPDARDCLEPGETIDLRFEWRLTDDYDGGPMTLDDLFEFEAVQCRYTDGDVNPFAGVGTESCGECVQDVSWIAFGVEGADAPQPGVKDSTELINSGTAVDWATQNDVDYVALKTGIGGQNEPYIVYDYTSGNDDTSGIAEVGDTSAYYLGDATGGGNFGGCPDKGADNPDSCPCQFSKDVVYGDPTAYFEGTSTKLEVNSNGELEEA